MCPPRCLRPIQHAVRATILPRRSYPPSHVNKLRASSTSTVVPSLSASQLSTRSRLRTLERSRSGAGLGFGTEVSVVTHNGRAHVPGTSRQSIHLAMGRPMFGGVYLLQEPAGYKPPVSKPAPKGKLRTAKAVLKGAARQNEMLFRVADADSDNSLSYVEFVALIRERLPHLAPEGSASISKDTTRYDNDSRKAEKLRQWFDALDLKGDGVINPLGFFLFSIREAIFRVLVEEGDASAGISEDNSMLKDLNALSILITGARCDKLRIGRDQLDKLASKLGLSFEVGEQLFDEVAAEHGKTNDKMRGAEAPGRARDEKELDGAFFLRTVHVRTAGVRPLILEWVRRGARKGGEASPDQDKEAAVESLKLDEQTLRELRATSDVHTVLRRLREVLCADLQRAKAIFTIFDTDGSFAIGTREFAAGLDAMGIRRSKDLTKAIFDELDDDDTHLLTFGEFKTWLFASEDEFARQLAD